MPSLEQSEKLAAELVRDAGGVVVGRTRLQKLAYLLERSGLGKGFPFEYRHYGPYSEELAEATDRAATMSLIEEVEKLATWGGSYSIFTCNARPPKTVDAARLKVAALAAKADAVELELAATAVYLASECKDPWGETERRKPQKAASGRLERARMLYQKLAEIKVPKPLPKI